MLDGIPKKEYPKLFYRYVKEFFEVLSGKTSLKLYLAYNYPSFYKAELKEGEILKWKGKKFKLPKAVAYSLEATFIMGGMYSIPECHVAQGDIVFDVGAHFGFFSCYALQEGAKKIYAFEPNPYVFEILKEHANIWNKEKIEPFCLALSSFEGEAELFLTNELGTVSTLLKSRDNTILRWQKYEKSVKVKTTTIDKFVEETNIEKVDFIKIDTEGYEREIIKGAKETIRKFKPKMAISAYHLPDDKEKIPELILSIRDDYRFKLVNKGDEDLFFF
ncbi:MAG: FkbM family methyltransferase [Archaeoglobaceae archaeon]